ncbi:MAG: Tn3 family transposase [Candidatus Dormibacteria bacterium]
MEARRWGRFGGEPTDEQLNRFFHLDPEDLRLARRRRGDATVLGFAVQVGTLRFLGTLLAQVEDTPRGVIACVARQLELPPEAWTDYASSRVRRLHAIEIRRLYGYTGFGVGPVHWQFLRWLVVRAWAADEPPSQLLDTATGWLIDHRVVLPGVTTLARLVAQVRDRAGQRAWRRLTDQLSASQRRRLLGLLDTDPATGLSHLERLRRPPRQPTIDGLVGALHRLAEIKALTGDRLDTSRLPTGRLRQLASEGLTVKAQKVAQRSPDRRLAVLAAFAAAVHRSAHDDAIDLFLLVVGELVNRIERRADKERLRTLGDLDAAAILLAKAVEVLVNPEVDYRDVRPAALGPIDLEELRRAIATVKLVAGGSADSVWTGLRNRYPHLNRFLPLLVGGVEFDATIAGHPVIAALTHLRRMDQGLAAISDAPLDIATGTWHPLVCPEPDVVDERAYRFCLVDRLRAALRRRDVFVPAADRWGDPRRLLLDARAWRTTRPQVLRSLDLVGGPRRFLKLLGTQLDDAYARAGEAVAADPELLVDNQDTGRQHLKARRLDAMPAPESTSRLQAELAPLLNSTELPELLLEVNAWTGFTDDFTHLSNAETRLEDHAVSVCAVLLTQACNVPVSTVARGDVAALRADRLAWVDANYVRADTVTTANNRLVDYQTTIPITAHWGGGEVTSADGLRFTVPVQSISTRPNPRYFGTGRGVTFFNYVADNYIGWANVLVPGTLRDSQYILDGLLHNHSSLDPREIMTDSGSASDLVFGLFKLLGYTFSPRLADLPDRRYFRLDPRADYGPLNRVARHRVNTQLIVDQWDDSCRVAGTLHTRAATASQVIRTLQRAGQPTTLGRAIAEIGRIGRTAAMLAYVTSEAHRRRILTQLNRQEARHALARDVFHGRRGNLYQAYRTGQEQQLGALGLVCNAVTLWNSRYTDRAVATLVGRGREVDSADLERISPLHHETINLHGRYTFTIPDPVRAGQLRPLPRSAGDA